LCDDEGIGARSPGDELAAPPAKEEAALIRFSFGRFCIHCSTDVSFWPIASVAGTCAHRVDASLNHAIDAVTKQRQAAKPGRHFISPFVPLCCHY
jgi:hypothetical protein